MHFNAIIITDFGFVPMPITALYPTDAIDAACTAYSLDTGLRPAKDFNVALVTDAELAAINAGKPPSCLGAARRAKAAARDWWVEPA